MAKWHIKKNYLIAILNLLQEIVNGSAGSIIAYAVIINKTYSVIVYKLINIKCRIV